MEVRATVIRIWVRAGVLYFAFAADEVFARAREAILGCGKVQEGRHDKKAEEKHGGG